MNEICNDSEKADDRPREKENDRHRENAHWHEPWHETLNEAFGSNARANETNSRLHPDFPPALEIATGHSDCSAIDTESMDTKALDTRALDTKAIDKIFSDIKASHPGAQIAVLKNGEVIYEKGFGLANVGDRIPFSSDTAMEIASVSKQMTSMAVLMLVDRGAISLDKDIREYLPGLRTDHKITVRDLLQMKSGLADYSNAVSDKQLVSMSPEEFVKWTSDHKSVFAPGQKFHYNNGNYVLLALIVEAAAKQPFPEFMQKEIFGPLGMAGTSVLSEPELGADKRAGGYTKDRSGNFSWHRLETKLFGDGQVVTTAADLALWDKALFNNTLLKPETESQMYQSGVLNNGKKTGYGFGWEVGKDASNTVVSHNGSWAGVSTFIIRDRKSGMSVIVISNNDTFGAEQRGKKVFGLVANRPAN